MKPDRVSSSRWTHEDERRHPDAPVEAWWWWASAVEPETGELTGVYVGFELRGGRFDYWAGLVRDGHPYLYVEELDGTGLRSGLEIKPPEMWAGHECDVAFEQWSLGNEAHGVLLDDPAEAWRRAHGTLTPCTFDVEWYASAPPEELRPGDGHGLGGGFGDGRGALGRDGYRQWGEADVRIELPEGFVEFVGPAERVHVWGAPYLPTSFAMPSENSVSRRGPRAPYRRSDGLLVDQAVATSPTRGSRWWVTR